MITECLISAMEFEIEESGIYYQKAMKYKNDYPNISNSLIEIASQKLSTYEKLHSLMQNLISKTDDEENKLIWNYERNKLSKKFDEIKFKISKFNI